ncbi:MAG TPA: hypothetical protein VLC98_14385 [Phnomibacter sp.]|nr:hypothetical protein [Phnomibacter sp.]
MRLLSFLLAALIGWLSVSAQQTFQLTKVAELQMEKGKGSQGASVAWHAVAKKYYAAMAGNKTYPLCVFNEDGDRLSPSGTETLVDVRGLWFNSKKAKLQGNAYGEGGWYEYVLDSKGIPSEFKTTVAGASQPDDQCVGTFIAKTNQVLFFDGNDVYYYDAATGEVKESMSFEDMMKKSGLSVSNKKDYNNRSILYTGIAGKELGLINFEKSQIELFSLDGKLSTILKAPSGQLMYSGYNSAFANGLYWLFDKENAKWIGYKEGGSASSGTLSTSYLKQGGYGKLSKIITVGDLYSTYDIEESHPSLVSSLKSDWGEANTKEVLKRSSETGWPSAINSLSGRDSYRDGFVNYNCYYVSDLGSDRVLLWIPMSENKHMASALQGGYDYYMIYKRSAVQLGDKVKPRFSAVLGSGNSGSQGRATRINDPGQLYSTLDLKKDESGIAAQLEREYGTAGAAEILKRATESGWPYGISDFDRRSNYRARFTEYTAYYIADVGAEKVLLWIPMNKNKSVPSAMQGENDIYMVYARSAVTLGDKVRATVTPGKSSGNSGSSGGGQETNRTKPVTGTLGGAVSGTNNGNTKSTGKPATGNFQSQLESIIKAYADDFYAIKGSKLSKTSGVDWDEWETTIKLAGSVDAYLSEGVLNDHLEYMADFGSFSSKQSATTKMNAIIAEVLKAKPMGYSILKDESLSKETSSYQLLKLSSSAPKSYGHLAIEVAMRKSSEGSNSWVVELSIYSDEEE